MLTVLVVGFLALAVVAAIAPIYRRRVAKQARDEWHDYDRRHGGDN